MAGDHVSPTAARVKHAKKLIDSRETPSAVAGSLSVDRSTLYRAMKILT